MFLIGGALSFVLAVLPAGGGSLVADDSLAAARRIAATAQLAAQEYRVGVRDGKIVAAQEVEEAKLFVAEARRSAADLPADAKSTTLVALDGIDGLLGRVGHPDSVDVRVKALTAALAARMGVPLDEIPETAPSFARGAELYRNACASCHGDLGRGDGPAGAALDPKPANLASPDLHDQSPLDFYRRVTIGVVGTAMPSFEHQLSSADRWAVAAYATVLRLPAPAGDVPASLQSYPTAAAMSDEALATTLGEPIADSATLARIAAVRRFAGDTGSPNAAVFAKVRRQLDAAFALGAAGKTDAAGAGIFDAYLVFERVEGAVRTKDASLATELERAFARARGGMADAAERDAARADLVAKLAQAEQLLGETSSPTSLFIQSFVLLVREGLEALLIVGALLTFLTKTGATSRRRDVHLGVVAAVLASVATAIAFARLFEVSPVHREALEGATMLVATLVLFYVSYWLLSKLEVAKWTHFVRGRVESAVASGSAFALASAAFLAVYREGFETILFYKALFISAGPGAAVAPVVAGIIAGSIVLLIVYIAINRFGVRLPLKPFFALTSAFLYYMAFVFAGKGIAELQEGKFISSTPVRWGFDIPSLGIHPTVEGMIAQGLLLLGLVVALVWTFLVPKRLPVTSVMVPEPGAKRPTPTPTTPLAPAAQVDLLRSLERMEADLAELRAEVERMRGYISSKNQESVPRDP